MEGLCVLVDICGDEDQIISPTCSWRASGGRKCHLLTMILGTSYLSIFSGTEQGFGILCVFPRPPDIEKLKLVNEGLLVHTLPQFCAYCSSSMGGANREIHREQGFWKPTP